MIKEFLSDPIISLEVSKKKLNTFVGEILTGAIVADHRIVPPEKPLINELLSIYSHDVETLNKIDHILRSRKVPKLTNVDASPDFARRLLTLVTQICICDFELHLGEAEYIRNLAKNLNILPAESEQIIYNSAKQVRMNFFDSICKSLNSSERYWFSVIIFKVVYADGKLAKNELQYLQDIFHLLEGRQQEVEKVKQSALELNLEDLPRIYLDDDIARKVLRYLLEICFVDQEFDEEELKILDEIVDYLGFHKEIYKQLIHAVKMTYLPTLLGK
ncbi:MAG: putative tellurite resistance protein B-like protein [bacterium]|jgi:uncharacterized tellurite resistance protein B-like protein